VVLFFLSYEGMKKILLLLLLILIGCSSPDPINADELLYGNNERYYTKATDKPYSGEIFRGRLDRKSLVATLKNGYPIKFTEYYLFRGLEPKIKREGEISGWTEDGYYTYSNITEYYEKNVRDGIFEWGIVSATSFEDSNLNESFEYFPNGDIKSRYRLVKNSDEPPLSESYFSNGNLREKNFYEKDGDSWEKYRREIYFSNGNLREKNFYEKDGDCTSSYVSCWEEYRYETYTESGVLKNVRQINEDGDWEWLY